MYNSSKTPKLDAVIAYLGAALVLLGAVMILTACGPAEVLNSGCGGDARPVCDMVLGEQEQPQPGPQGPAGPSGQDGADGAAGSDGANGTDGAAGGDGKDATIDAQIERFGKCDTRPRSIAHTRPLKSGQSTRLFMYYQIDGSDGYYRFRVENASFQNRSYTLNFNCAANVSIDLAPGMAYWHSVPTTGSNCVLTVSGIGGTQTASLAGATSQNKIVDLATDCN